MFYSTLSIFTRPPFPIARANQRKNIEKTYHTPIYAHADPLRTPQKTRITDVLSNYLYKNPTQSSVR